MEVLKKLEERINSNAIKSDQIKESNEELSMIRKQLELIQSYIPESLKFSEPLTVENIQFIINSYSKFKFQEHSLSIKFQNLTEEQLEKQHKCDEIAEELHKLKADNEEFPSTQQSLTYNQMKAVTETENISKNTRNFENSFDMIIKSYLYLSNLSSTIVKTLNSISQYSCFHQNDNDLIFAINTIQKFQQGFVAKPEKEKKSLKKTVTIKEKTRTSKTDLENLEELMSFSISLSDIKEILIKYIKDPKFLNELASLIKTDRIACFFLDVYDIESKFSSAINN